MFREKDIYTYVYSMISYPGAGASGEVRQGRRAHRCGPRAGGSANNANDDINSNIHNTTTTTTNDEHNDNNNVHTDK